MLYKLNKEVSKFRDWFTSLEIYYQLLPFLLLYLTISIVFNTDQFVGDEKRFIAFAKNLLNGFYSPPAPEINLWNGPGYPIFLLPFILLKIPLLGLRLLNGILLYLSLIINYKTCCFYSQKKSSFIFTVILGLYFPIYEYLPLLLSEILAWFFVSLVCYLFISNIRNKERSWSKIAIVSASIAFLTMTKIIFGIVVIIMLIITVLFYSIPKFRSNMSNPMLIILFSLVLCIPYLSYTYSLTGKLFYWSNAGGESLYWMSSPYTDELGDWRFHTEAIEDASKIEQINHGGFFNKINQLDTIERDQALKKKALTNIQNNPQKYFNNWLLNISRMVFSYPYSYSKQSKTTLFTIIPNMIVLVIILLSLYTCYKNIGLIPVELKHIFIFIMVYLFGSSLVSAYSRMFIITIPFWVLFVSFVFNNVIEVRLRNKKT